VKDSKVQSLLDLMTKYKLTIEDLSKLMKLDKASLNRILNTNKNSKASLGYLKALVDEQRQIKYEEAEIKNLLDTLQSSYDFKTIIDNLGDKTKILTFLESKKQ